MGWGSLRTCGLSPERKACNVSTLSLKKHAKGGQGASDRLILHRQTSFIWCKIGSLEVLVVIPYVGKIAQISLRYL